MAEAFSDFFKYIFDTAFVIQMLCISVSTVLLLRGFNKSGKVWQKILWFSLDTFCLAVVFFILNLFLFVLGKTAGGYIDSVFTYLLGIALYTLIRSRHKWTNRLVMMSVIFSLCTLMASLGTLLGNAIEFNVDGFDIIITKIISYFVVVASSVVFYRYPIFNFETTLFDCVLNVVCNFLSAALVIIFSYWRSSLSFLMFRDSNFSNFISIAIIFLLIINIVTYFMTFYLCRERERVLEYQAEKQKGLTIKEMLKLSERNMTELREVQHDIKNQYAYMQSMLEGGEYSKLKDYFGELVGTFSKNLYEHVDCGNTMVDSILNLELSKALGAGVKMNVKAAIPAELPFSQAGLLGLFTNVIDNAIESCAKRGGEDDCIDVVLSLKGDYLLFCVTNPVEMDDVENIEAMPTDKKDKALHGFGIKIIRKIVKKYNGHHRAYIKEGKFVSESLLDLEYKNKS